MKEKQQPNKLKETRDVKSHKPREEIVQKVKSGELLNTTGILSKVGVEIYPFRLDAVELIGILDKRMQRQ